MQAPILKQVHIVFGGDDLPDGDIFNLLITNFEQEFNPSLTGDQSNTFGASASLFDQQVNNQNVFNQSNQSGLAIIDIQLRRRVTFHSHN